MKTLHKLINKTLLLSTITIASLVSLPASADSDALHHSGQASKHTSLAIGHGAVSGTKVASAVVAAPIVLVGGLSVVAGSGAMAVGDSIVSGGNSIATLTHKNTPLEITNITITADPAPNQQIDINLKERTKTTTITTTEIEKAVEKTTVEH